MVGARFLKFYFLTKKIKIMKKRYFLLPLLLFIALSTFSQTAISGKVIDNELNEELIGANITIYKNGCLLYTSPSPRDQRGSRMPSSA